ncbi:MAG: hypothetical protein EBX49_01375 [Synechococcaceae bacterium WB8_1B_136]|nr:hypothetical protein [Synechococcaceae bacterium WB8_1B_136]
MNSAFKTPRRISITVPCAIYDQLVEKSGVEGRSISNLAAYLLESALAPAPLTPTPLAPTPLAPTPLAAPRPNGSGRISLRSGQLAC